VAEDHPEVVVEIIPLLKEHARLLEQLLAEIMFKIIYAFQLNTLKAYTVNYVRSINNNRAFIQLLDFHFYLLSSTHPQSP
jgi:hypothetical protein